MKINQLLTLLIGLLLSSCNKCDFSEIELLSISGRALDYNNTDSLTLGIFINSYAQKDNDGNCIMFLRTDERRNEFSSFKVNKDLFQTIQRRLKNINSDTLLTTKSEGILYDGPQIQLLVHKNNGYVNRLSFINSNRTDKDFLSFYNNIDSCSQYSKNKAFFDTTRLIHDRDILINKIKVDAFKNGITFGRDSIVIIK
jgi:hypothetical protein